MRWAAVIVVVALGAIALTQTMHLAVQARSKAWLVSSAALCWDQNVVMRGKLPQWDR